MSYVHTIALALGAVGTRTSKGRQYGACVVATVTADSIRIHAEKMASAASSLTMWRGTLADRMIEHGVTVAEARAHYEKSKDRYFGDERNEIMKHLISTTRLHGDALHAKVDAELQRRGVELPWDPNGKYGVVEAADRVANLERTLAEWPKRVKGSQDVVSWHRDARLAVNAIGGYAHLREQGYRLEVRTDVKVRETVRKAARS